MSYMPLRKHEVQSFNQNSVASASENHSSAYDEQAKPPSTADSTKSEKPDWDPAIHGHTNRKAPQAAKGMIQLMKSLLLPIIGEDIHLEMNRPFSDAILSAIAYLTFCYTVHNRMVPVAANDFLTRNASPADIGSFHSRATSSFLWFIMLLLATVKSGITSISILLIAIGLWPLKDLVENIKVNDVHRTRAIFFIYIFIFWTETERRIFPYFAYA